MGIIDRYTIREVLGQTLGVFSIVLTIFVVQRMGVLLQEAAEGSVGFVVTLKLLGLRTIMALPSLLPVALYASVLLGISHLSLQQELTAMYACGISPWRVQRSVMIFATGVALITGLLAFSIRPWSAIRFDALRREAAAGLELGSLVPGRFYEVSAADDYVVFADRRPRDKDGFLERVFVQQRRDERISIFSSNYAVEYRDEDAGYRFLRLIDGYRYDFSEEKRNYTTTQFGDLVIRAPISPLSNGDTREEGLPTSTLWGSAGTKMQAELQWRAAQPAAVLVLALFAIPLGRTDSRRGRSARVFVAILIYIVYRNLLGMARSWVQDGSLPVMPGVWLVHVLAIAIAVPLLWRDARR